jgi:hypothetical protein
LLKAAVIAAKQHHQGRKNQAIFAVDRNNLRFISEKTRLLT